MSRRSPISPEKADALLEQLGRRAMQSAEVAEYLSAQSRAAKHFLSGLIDSGKVVRLGWSSKAVFVVAGSAAHLKEIGRPTPIGRTPEEPAGFVHRVVRAADTTPPIAGPRWVFDAHQKQLSKRRNR